MDKHKLILPISILLGCIILGGFYYTSQVNKQQSIERQQQIKLLEDRRVEEAKSALQDKLNSCLAAADSYNDARYQDWKNEEFRQAKRDDCYKRFK